MDIYSLANCMVQWSNGDHQNVSLQFQRCLSKVLCSNDEEPDGKTREDEDGDEIHAELELVDDVELFADGADEVLADGACQVESSCCVCCCYCC